MADITLSRVRKVYPGGVEAVADLDLHAADGELLVLLGPSGCGKSTVLRLVAGLEGLTSGEIHIGGRRVDTEAAQQRDVAMVFQSYALYGHMSVRQNIEFPLRMRGVSRGERRRRAEEVAAMLELERLLDARPAALSGGQQQRVAMGRALVREPRAFLLDEPLSNLDARLRAQVRGHIAGLQKRLGITTLHVTHDQVEAMSLGDRVAVLRAGRLQQVAPGQELYDRPANTFVAAFVGQPGMNLLAGTLRRSGSVWSIDLGATALPLPAAMAAGLGGLEERNGGEVVLGIRPEALELAQGAAATTLEGRVRAVEALGNEHVVHLEIAPRLVDAAADGTAEGRPPLLAIRLDARAASPEPGDVMRLSARMERARLFDAGGRALGNG
jgi:multiple sugar transport system ATP-binding protein